MSHINYRPRSERLAHGATMAAEIQKNYTRDILRSDLRVAALTAQNKSRFLLAVGVGVAGGTVAAFLFMFAGVL